MPLKLVPSAAGSSYTRIALPSDHMLSLYACIFPYVKHGVAKALSYLPYTRTGQITILERWFLTAEHENILSGSE